MIEEEEKAMDLVNDLLKEIPTDKLKYLKLEWMEVSNTKTLMPSLKCEFYERENDV